jgi:serine/threonine-protein kinase
VTESRARLTTALADRYRIERELGQGGLATVYVARDLKHDRDVAIKVLRPEITAILGSARFLEEIRISPQLDHPHILTLIDSGEADGVLYYVLPYVRGESLRQKITRERQLSIEEALAITHQVASALDYAHRRGHPPRHRRETSAAEVRRWWRFRHPLALRRAGASGSRSRGYRSARRST